MAFRAAGAVATATSGNVTPALPSGWAADDIFICLIASRDNVSQTMPAGWTAIDAGTNNTGGFRMAAFYRRAVAGDTDPLVTHSAGSFISAVIVAYSGRITTGDPRDVTGATSVNAASTTLTFHASGITTTVADCDVVALGGVRTSGAGTVTSSTYTGTPTPLERVDGPTVVNQPQLVIADFLQATAASTGERSSTLTSSLLNNGILVALKPAAGTTPLTQTASDDLNNLSDAHTKVIGQLITLTDDANNLSDGYSQVVGIPKEVSDDGNNLADSYLQRLGILKTLADVFNVLSDYFVYGRRPRWQDGYSQAGTTSLSLADNVNNLADSCAYSNKPRWQDSISRSAGIPKAFTDDHSIVVTDGAIVSSTTTLTCATSVPFTSADVGKRIVVDGAGSGGANLVTTIASFSSTASVTVADAASTTVTSATVTFNQWRDAPATNLAGSISLIFSDNLNAWGDNYAQTEGQLLLFSDNANSLADSYAQIEGLLIPFADNINNLAEFCGLGYGLACIDSAPGLADSFSSQAGQPLSFSDNLYNWGDSASVQSGQLLIFADAITLADTFTSILGFGLAFSDNALNLIDAVNLSGQALLSASDSLNQSDQCSINQGQLIGCSDQFGLTDGIALGFGYVLVLTDGPNNFADLVQFTNLAATDKVLSDSFTLSDAIVVRLGFAVISGDSINNWLDSFVMQRPHAVFVVKVLAEERTVRVP